jgi:hypothetical protein
MFRRPFGQGQQDLVPSLVGNVMHGSSGLSQRQPSTHSRMQPDPAGEDVLPCSRVLARCDACVDVSFKPQSEDIILDSRCRPVTGRPKPREASTLRFCSVFAPHVNPRTSPRNPVTRPPFASSGANLADEGHCFMARRTKAL